MNLNFHEIEPTLFKLSSIYDFMAEMTDSQKLDLEMLVEELKEYRGRHTEFITVYIPAGFDKNQVAKQIEDEKGTATNIKSNSTRKNVINALEKASRKLKEIKQTPPNGLAVFAGNVSDVEGKEDMQAWAVEPPKPLKIRLYRCDQTFVLEPLEEMLENDDVYGLLIIERKEASIGVLDGNSIKVLQHMTSGIPGKVRAGGQSSQRFHRITEGLAKEFFRRVAEEMKNQFFENKKLKGILIGGPVPTKDEFLETGNLVTSLKDKVIAVRDIGGTEMNGLKELVEACKDVLAEQEITKQKKILDEFFEMLAKEPEKIAYGEAEVEQRLNEGAVGKLIISKSLPRDKIKFFEKLAVQTSPEIHVVTSETTEGVQFDNLGGIGGVLRFAMG
jgi:peptide chain release factor subunit 1